jgi:hypothetical protein
MTDATALSLAVLIIAGMIWLAGKLPKEPVTHTSSTDAFINGRRPDQTPLEDDGNVIAGLFALAWICVVWVAYAAWIVCLFVLPFVLLAWLLR